MGEYAAMSLEASLLHFESVDEGGGVGDDPRRLSIPEEVSAVDSDLELAIEKYHQSIDAFVKGEGAERQKPLWSRQDDVTLANPLGPPARGWDTVEAAMDQAASVIREGEPIRYERISEYATPDLAYILEIEHGRARFGGSGEARSYSLRVTTILRHEDGEWRLTHRHADPITAPRPADSVFKP